MLASRCCGGRFKDTFFRLRGYYVNVPILVTAKFKFTTILLLVDYYETWSLRQLTCLTIDCARGLSGSVRFM